MVFDRKQKNAAALRAERAMQMHLARMQHEEPQPVMEQQTIGEGESEQPIMQEAPFRGSMDTVSTEGECLCDPVLEHEREAVTDSESVYAGEIGREPLFDLSAKGIVQGVVMSEILQRPAPFARRIR